jgi:hypothetical protein
MKPLPRTTELIPPGVNGKPIFALILICSDVEGGRRGRHRMAPLCRPPTTSHILPFIIANSLFAVLAKRVTRRTLTIANYDQRKHWNPHESSTY